MSRSAASDRGLASPRVVIAGAALGSASSWNITNVGAIASEVASAYTVGLAVVGLFTTALFLTHLVAQIPGGRLVDKVGARRVGFYGLAAIALGTTVALTGAELPLALAGRSIAGIGTGLAFIAGSAYVRASGGSALAQGVFGGVALSAGGLAVAVVPALEGMLSWRASYWTALAVVGLALILLCLAPRDIPASRISRGVRGRSLIRDRDLLRLGFLYAASFGGSVVVSNWIVEILERNAGASLVSAGSVGATILVLGVVSRPLGGWILSTHPELARPTARFSMVAGALGTLIVMEAGSLSTAALGGALIGIGGGLPFSLAFTGAAEARPDAPAAAVGLVNASANALMIAVIPVVGLTFSLPGGGRLGFGLVIGLWLGALLLPPGGRALGGTDGRP